MKLAHKKNLVHFYFRILAKNKPIIFDIEFKKVNNGKRYKHQNIEYIENYIYNYYRTELNVPSKQIPKLIEEIKKGYLY